MGKKQMRHIVKIPHKSIADDLDIFSPKYDTYDDIPAAKKAWITIKSKQQGKNPVMVHAGIKAAFTKRNAK
jgi:hypothetical protein